MCPTANTLIDSGDVEKYTPQPIIEAAREAMGGIDLDPASSVEANRIVKAGDIMTRDEDGLKWIWYGRVWMNHPFSPGWIGCTDGCKRVTCKKRGYHVRETVPSNADWINKLLHDYKNRKTVTQACCITYASTSEVWFRPLLRYPQCFIHGRTNYLNPDGSVQNGVQKGSCVTYLGDDVERFAKAFKKIGTVKVRL